MELGVAIHLGGLLSPATLQRAEELRPSGVTVCNYANAFIDPADVVANGLVLSTVVETCKNTLRRLDEIGMGVGIRVKPDILLQQGRTPNLLFNRTSLEAAKLLVPFLGTRHYLIAQHECHDTTDSKMRAYFTQQLGTPRTVWYYGRSGLDIKYGADFGKFDVSHVVHVALNAAGELDPSSVGEATGPDNTTGESVANAVRKFAVKVSSSVVNVERYTTIGHINVLPTTPVVRLVSLLLSAAVGWKWDVLMLRLVNAQGGTLEEGGKHLVTPNVLEAIQECSWLASTGEIQ